MLNTFAVPSLFIGSSSEGLDVARAIEMNLKDDAEITIWSNGVFGLNEGYLESLVTALERFDFSVLVLTPDDLVSSRDIVSQAPRDNVMFELGLFMGRLGKNRTFAICSDSPNMKFPTDFAGVMLDRFQSDRSDGNLIAALSPACFRVRQAIRELGFSEARVAKRLTSATTQVEGLSGRIERMVYLMARSRIIELEHIRNNFGGLLDRDFTDELIKDIKLLKSETEAYVPDLEKIDE